MKNFFEKVLLILCLVSNCLDTYAQDVSNEDLKACAEYKDKAELNFLRWKASTREYAKLSDSLSATRRNLKLELSMAADSIIVISESYDALNKKYTNEIASKKLWRNSFLVTVSLFLLLIVFVVLVIQRFNFSPKTT